MNPKLKLILSGFGITSAIGAGTALTLYWPEQTDDEVVEEEKKSEPIKLVKNPEKKGELKNKISKIKYTLNARKEWHHYHCEVRYYAGRQNDCWSLEDEIVVKEKELKNLETEIAKFE